MDVPVTPTLRRISVMFHTAGHELWLVGGCVRDTLLGIVPKDIDLATSATPDEQMAIYEANGIRYEPTGLQHGTITVIADGEIYEITTFRIDVETDGRHAVVSYTRDLAADLERRDLTINAMAMDFEGTLVDPFGGRADLEARRLKFVGDPISRIREDYLRILRWFRFLGRFSVDGEIPTDYATREAIRQEAKGLSRISVERIWSEMERIITGPSPLGMVRLMRQLGVAEAIGLPSGYDARIVIAQRHGMDAATTLGGYAANDRDPTALDRLVIHWKLSNAEKFRARFVHQHVLSGSYPTWAAKADLVKGRHLRLVTDTMHLAGNSQAVAEIEGWTVPVFPVLSADLLGQGMTQGLALGERLRAMKARWMESDYGLTKNELLEVVK